MVWKALIQNLTLGFGGNEKLRDIVGAIAVRTGE